MYWAIFGMVTNKQPNEQLGDPSASLLLTSVRRQSFAIVLGSLFNLVLDFVLFSKNFDCWLTLLVGVFAQLGRKVSEEILQLLRAKIQPDFVKRIQQTRI